MLIGAGSGLLVGGFVGFALEDSPDCGSCFPDYAERVIKVGLTGAVVGGLLGLAIGASWPGEEWESVPLAAESAVRLFLDTPVHGEGLTVGVSLRRTRRLSAR